MKMEEEEEQTEEEIEEEEQTEDFENKRWCGTCNKHVNTRGKKKNICVNCGQFTAKFKPEANQEEIEEKSEKGKEIKKEAKEKEYRLTALRPVNLSGQESAAAEVLINAGFAKNFNDLVRKSIDEMYQRRIFFGQQLNLKEKKMEEEPNPKMTMKQIQEQEIMEAYAQKLRGEKETSPEKTMAQIQSQKLVEAFIKNMDKGGGSQTDPLQFMMLMRMLENKNEGKENKDNNFMDKIMQLQMIKSLSGGDQQVVALQRELVDLKRDMQMQQLIQQSQKGTPLQDQIMALEKIRAERDREVKEMDVKFQQERDKNLSMAMETRVREIEKAISQSGGSLNTQRLQEFKEELKAIKEMSHELGEREKGAGEYISETIGNVASTLQPALTKLIEQKERRAMQPEFLPPYAPEQFEQPQAQPQASYEMSELTPTEREMSDQMSDMYIKKKK